MDRDSDDRGETRNTDGFLELLYADGMLDGSRFAYGYADKNERRVAEIIQRYRALIRNYPASQLEEAGYLPETLWEGLKGLGIFGLNVPREYGGLGLSLTEYLSIIEAMARDDMALAIIPTAHLSIGIKGILLFGSEQQKRAYLPRAASGEMIFAYALTEPEIGSDARHIETRAGVDADGTHYLLNGTKTYITNGGYAGGLTVFAQMDPARPGFMGAFIVETGWPGVRVGRPMPKMGLTISSTTTISFANVRVPRENLIGKSGDGFKIAMTILNYGRLGLGAASTGAMRQSFQDMLKRADARKQFGEPIGNFDLVREKIVRAHVNGTVAGAMTRFTAKLLQESPTASVAIESSHTKLFGTTRGWNTLYDALQIAGGAGYLSTQPYEKRMRDFRVTTVFEGTTEIHSIYPPLLLIRRLGKRLAALRRSPFQKLALLYRMFASPIRVPLETRDSLLRPAVDFVTESVRRVRRHLVRALLQYRADVTREQFLLRRITNLSMHAYGVLCLAAQVGAKEREGKDARSDRRALAWFLEEAGEMYRRESRFARSTKEELGREFLRDISVFDRDGEPHDPSRDEAAEERSDADAEHRDARGEQRETESKLVHR